MRQLYLLLALLFSVFFTFGQQQKTLIKNVNLWDGTSKKLQEGMDLLITDNLITEIAKNIVEAKADLIIDGNGKTMIPGLIDAHVHLASTMSSSKIRNDMDWMYTAMRAAKSAEIFLMLGFTTVRDLGGPSFGIKKAVDEDLYPGPRIYPSGAYISQTSGHGDGRNPNEPSTHWSGGPMHPSDAMGWSFVVDGVSEVLKASRENLRKGATQLKVMAGGGIDSEFDPIHSIQFTVAEMEAAVQAAADWDTYVAVHIYNAKGAIRALNAGVKCLDHGHLINEEVIKLLKEKDAWLVPQTFWTTAPPDFWAPGLGTIPPELDLKIKPVLAGTVNAMNLAKKYAVNIGFGSDAYGNLGFEKLALTEFTARTQWFTPIEILKQATSENAKLLGLSGQTNPYREGKLGVIEVGSYADLLIYQGNPLKNLDVIVKPKENLKLIMKDGKLFKNELSFSTNSNN